MTALKHESVAYKNPILKTGHLKMNSIGSKKRKEIDFIEADNMYGIFGIGNKIVFIHSKWKHSL